jgi:hypothetical protein
MGGGGRWGLNWLLFSLAAFLLALPAFAESKGGFPLSAGAHYTGAHVRWAFSSQWALEARYSVGEDKVEEEQVSTKIYGAGLTRIVASRDDWRYYLGARGGWITGKAGGSSHGYAGGVNAGLEKFVSRRVSLTLDMGPYYLWIKNPSGLADNQIDVVVDAAVYFHWGGRP